MCYDQVVRGATFVARGPGLLAMVGQLCGSHKLTTLRIKIVQSEHTLIEIKFALASPRLKWAQYRKTVTEPFVLNFGHGWLFILILEIFLRWRSSGFIENRGPFQLA